MAAAAPGGRRFFFSPCRIRLLQGTHPRLCGPCAADQGVEKAMDRLADMAFSLGKSRREEGAYRPGGPSLDCRLGTAGYAPGGGDCRVRTALTLTLAKV